MDTEEAISKIINIIMPEDERPEPLDIAPFLGFLALVAAGLAIVATFCPLKEVHDLVDKFLGIQPPASASINSEPARIAVQWNEIEPIPAPKTENTQGEENYVYWVQMCFGLSLFYAAFLPIAAILWALIAWIKNRYRKKRLRVNRECATKIFGIYLRKDFRSRSYLVQRITSELKAYKIPEGSNRARRIVDFMRTSGIKLAFLIEVE